MYLPKKIEYTISMNHQTTLCPKYERVFSWIGKRWNGLILRCLYQSPMRFREIATCVKNCSDKVLTDRLKELETEGLIVLKANKYVLTQMGIQLNQALNEIQKFADENL